ncbi:antibiotic biosynthesis monooxygenase [Actinomadura macra]|uniref:antibiotic biosynthesis monooxygenase n=1 Tax=Actinomadura macra TaxID=46164 RepID=UPI0008374A22|nr:antibiotic biosynthesis monooxygenase [Actinomadura macra]
MKSPTTPVVPVDRLKTFNVVVPDLRAHAEHYARILDMVQWTVDTVHGVRSGDGGTYSARRAVATAPWGGAVALIEPMDGDGPYTAFGKHFGIGVHSLIAELVDPAGFEPASSWLAQKGVGHVAVESRDGGEVHYFDTRDDLGGYHLGIFVPTGADAAKAERWDLSSAADRPGDVQPLNIPHMHHFGVVVESGFRTTAKYAELWGLTEWVYADYRPEYGSLDDPEYRGEPEAHGFFCGFGFDFHNFGFEIIQPTRGVSDYGRLFLEKGPAVHHLNLVVVDDVAAFQKTASWLETKGVGIIQYSRMNAGAAVYYYLDTRALLGWVIEAYGVLKPTAGPPKPYLGVAYSHPALAEVRSGTVRDESNVRVLVQMRAAEGKAEEFRAGFDPAASLAEDGCLQYELFQSTSDPHHFALVELWGDPDLYDAHWAAEAERWKRRAESDDGRPDLMAPSSESPTGQIGTEFYTRQRYEVSGQGWIPVREG